MVLFWSGIDQELAPQLDFGWELHHLTCLSHPTPPSWEPAAGKKTSEKSDNTSPYLALEQQCLCVAPGAVALHPGAPDLAPAPPPPLPPGVGMPPTPDPQSSRGGRKWVCPQPQPSQALREARGCHRVASENRRCW